MRLAPLLALAGLVCLSPRQSPSAAQNAAAPFSISINATEGTVEGGSEVRVRIVLTGTAAARTVIIREAQQEEENVGFAVDVRNDEGKAVPLSDFGRAFFNRRTAFHGCPEIVGWRPGKTLTGTFVISDLFDFSHPAKYAIQVKRTDAESKAVVRSNTIIVTVIESSAPGATATQARHRAIMSAGFSLTIGASKNVVKVGSQIGLSVSLSNDSLGEIGGSDEGDEPDFGYTFDVQDEKGAAAPDTEFGRRRKRDMLPQEHEPVRIISPGPLITVPPGGTYIDKVDVTKLVDMSRPGKYTIQVHWGMVKSNRIKVTVTE
jgi:hypothetical protein